MDYIEQHGFPPPYNHLGTKEVLERPEMKAWMRSGMPKFKGSPNQDPNVHIDDFFWLGKD